MYKPCGRGFGATPRCGSLLGVASGLAGRVGSPTLWRAAFCTWRHGGLGATPRSGREGSPTCHGRGWKL
eukprot:12081811-Alexandrium_andersonii.AAC.1